jgi:peptidoglycan/xylan/chitin deacetylase (PgdA/CDA1 family)
MRKSILITFDVEEFDLPIEYGNNIDFEEQINVSTVGLLKILDLLKKHNIQATFFVTAVYAEQNPQLIRKIAENNEVASHTYYHSQFEPSHILSSKLKLEEITGKPVYGLRMPRLEKIELKLVKDAGYSYDSSLNPTYIPGRYNNFFKPASLFIDAKSGLKVLPFSVSPFFRFPLFWLSFKNVRYNVYLFLCKWSLRKNKYLHLYFHPWEFSDISHYNIPQFTKKISGDALLNRFDSLLSDLKKEGEFSTIIDFIDQKSNYNRRQKNQEPRTKTLSKY